MSRPRKAIALLIEEKNLPASPAVSLSHYRAASRRHYSCPGLGLVTPARRAGPSGLAAAIARGLASDSGIPSVATVSCEVITHSYEATPEAPEEQG
jgi:hypothetical protein